MLQQSPALQASILRRANGLTVSTTLSICSQHSSTSSLLTVSAADGHFCNRLPTLYRDTRSSPGRLQDGVNATLYIDRRSILLADHCSYFSYLLPYYPHLLRVYIELLELHSQSSRSCIPHSAKAYTYPTYYTL